MTSSHAKGDEVATPVVRCQQREKTFGETANLRYTLALKKPPLGIRRLP